MFRAACRPSWIAAGATPGTGFAVLLERAPGRRSRRPRRWPGMRQVGLDQHAPGAVERRRPACAPAARPPRPPPRGRCASRSARRRASTPSASMPVTRGAGPHLDAEAARAAPAAFAESVGGVGGEHPRPPFEQDDARAGVGSMRRKSRASAWRAISASAPASSTPVGPAADDHEGQPGAAALGSGSRSAASKAKSTRRRISSASSMLLRPGASGAHSSWPKMRMRRAGREDQVVVGELAVGEDDLRAVASTPPPPPGGPRRSLTRGARCGSATRCRRGSAPRSPPGRAAAGRGGGSGGRRS